jgi:CheY-like chemotaxis protein
MDERMITPRPQCVLVVDEMADARESWTVWLTLWGFHPVHAADGREALVKAAAHQPSVILMDLWTSMIDATGAIQQLKRHPATAHIPVIALTAHTYAPAHARALAVEAARVVVKPCEANVLLEHIRAVMRRTAA